MNDLLAVGGGSPNHYSPITSRGCLSKSSFIIYSEVIRGFLHLNEIQEGTLTDISHKQSKSAKSNVKYDVSGSDAVDSLSVCSVELGQLRTGTGMEVSLTLFSWQRWDAATAAAPPPPPDSLRR